MQAGATHIQVTMKDGEVYDMEGGVERHRRLGDRASTTPWATVKVEWDKHRSSIVFAAGATEEPKPPAYRLYGVVETEDRGSFEGHVQWDIQECLSIGQAGRRDGRRRPVDQDGPHQFAIEKRNRSGSHVELKDGRKMVLEDTNDVDDSLRGIHVDDPRFGRVT